MTDLFRSICLSVAMVTENSTLVIRFFPALEYTRQKKSLLQKHGILTTCFWHPCREQKGHIDKRQLIISDKDHTVLGRLPGQLNGKQFLISNCKNCTILVLDYTGTVTVDKCTECHIFIAPCKGR